jgi:hypothetical protein
MAAATLALLLAACSTRPAAVPPDGPAADPLADTAAVDDRPIADSSTDTPDDGSAGPLDAQGGAEPPVVGPACSTGQPGQWMGVSSQGAADPIGRTWVWTGREILIWGGDNAGTAPLVGTAYDPVQDSWRTLAMAGAPSARAYPSAAWTGSEMIVWGGAVVAQAAPFTIPTATLLADGGRYDPVADRWQPISQVGAPSARGLALAIWTGQRMLVWGGGKVPSVFDFNDGGRYDPVTDSWSPMTTVGAPTPRASFAYAWTGKWLLVWSGFADTPPGTSGLPNDGARYDPVADRWTPMSTVNAPSGRSNALFGWSGRELVVWGGQGPLADGGRYDPGTDTWTSITPSCDLRTSYAGGWSGSQLVVVRGTQAQQCTPPGSDLPCPFVTLDSTLVYDVTQDRWSEIQPSGAPDLGADGPIPPAIWTGSQLVFLGGNPIQGTFVGARYVP